MEELNELYNDILLDHSKSSMNKGHLACGFSSDGINPLCGDTLTIDIAIENDVISDIKFECSGCAISSASCSIMVKSVKGKSVECAIDLFNKFKSMLINNENPELQIELLALKNIRNFPNRVKCAVLAWNTLKDVLQKTKTEERRIL